MNTYANLNGNSNVIRYYYCDDYIIVEFKSGLERFYRYDKKQIGETEFYRLIMMADRGYGLNGALSRKDHPNYSNKGNSCEI